MFPLIFLSVVLSMASGQTGFMCWNGGWWLGTYCNQYGSCSSGVCNYGYCCSDPYDCSQVGGKPEALRCGNSNDCAGLSGRYLACVRGTCCSIESRCPSGYELVAVMCQQSYQCARPDITLDRVACINNQCCKLTSSRKCSNGGTVVALGCTNDGMCQQQLGSQYPGIRLVCLGNECCTVPAGK
ncbi:hypothetical protein AB6A40_009029 [Gnathostoma spinigerum]|uniref:Uncharacterized protein n=1 Tax=Gnathostoma spinigerum TaxID=75299 RepID=A0ABD6F0T7_9BILA